ncbi:MAG: glutamine amidotransferase, partial [Spirochaetaceae bacterium]|nr:glutamine amidotransferase [Spirochaetaceae bacterium]
ADFRSLASRLAASGVSMSTIGIGDEVNEELLRNIAEWSGGAYHRALLDQVPRIVDRETVRMTRDLMQEGDIAVRSSSDSPVVAGIASVASGPAPRIGGYLLVKAKSLATVLLEAESPQSPGRLDPLLAVWRYGNGRSAVFSSDSGKRWLSSWSGRPEYNRLWAQIVKEIERPGRSTGLRASAVVEGGNAHLIVEALGPDRRSLSGLRLVGRTAAGSPRSFALSETASGRYEGYAILAEPGLGAFEILDPTTGSWTSAWVWNPPGAELAGLGPDRAALAAIAEATGGRLAEPEDLEAPPASLRWLSIPSRGFLAGLAIALLLAELFLRSAMFGQLARAIVAVREWITLQSSLAAALRKAPRSPFRIPSDEEDRIEMERRMRLAEHVARHVTVSVSSNAVSPTSTAPVDPVSDDPAARTERRDG